MSLKRDIAQWKIDSPLERWLGRRADHSGFWKGIYVFYYRLCDPGYYKNGIRMIEACLERHGKGDITSSKKKLYARDMVYSLHRFGFMFDEYFWYDLEHRNASGRREFISDKVRYSIYDDLNLDSAHELLTDKWKTYLLFREYFGREVLLVNGHSDKHSFVEFCKAHPKFLVKPLGGNCGKGVELCNVKADSDALDTFESLRGGVPFVMEELINQAPEMAAFHCQSVNTVRMPTIVSGEDVFIFGPFFRMGRGDSFVDNAGANGVFANVDSETGIVCTPGVDEAGNRYLEHPDSKKVIPGFRIPRWEEAVELARSLALKMQEQGARYVGWDLALTNAGWVVVEGNSRAQFVMQIADERGRMKELLRLVYGDASAREK